MNFNKNKHRLDEEVEKAKQNGVRIPNTQQVLAHDSRLITSIGVLRDLIRRQFACEEISINIEGLDLRYRNEQLSESNQFFNVNSAPWVECKVLLEDPAITDLLFQVTFKPIEEDEEDVGIFETTEPPPALSTFFEQHGTDIVVNQNALNEMALAMLASAPETGNAESDLGAEPAASAQMPAPLFLEGLFAENTGDLGAPPDPMKKFGTNEEAMIAWYGGYRVLEKEQRQSWQQMALTKVTMNKTSSTVLMDKLPKTLDAGQRQAIETAKFFAQQGAVAMEAEERIGQVGYPLDAPSKVLLGRVLTLGDA